MFVHYRGNILALLGWQWKAVGIYSAGGALAVLLEHNVGIGELDLPTLPVTVVGAAIGIFVSFRTNACYDRWWEGRKLWGRLINTSRHFCTQVLTLLPTEEGKTGHASALQKELIHRHIAYVHALRLLLRQQDFDQDEDWLPLRDDLELHDLTRQSNPTHALLHQQSQVLSQLAAEGRLDERRLQSLDQSISALLDIQGGCERIKKTPFPRTYGYLASRLVWAYSIMFPLAVVDRLVWVTVPVTVLVCLSFTLINEAGRVLEDPFTLFWPALPLSALSRTIDVNLRERLGEAELPPLLTPNERGVLM